MLMDKSAQLVHIQISFYTGISFKGNHDIVDMIDLSLTISGPLIGTYHLKKI